MTAVTRIDEHADPQGVVAIDCLVVRLDRVAYALRLADVAEVHQLVAATATPDARGGFVGYVDVRGRVVPIVDLRLALNGECLPWDASMHMVVARAGIGLVALAVDRVDGVVPGILESPGTAVEHAAVGAVARTEELGLVPVLDPDALLEPVDGALDATDAAREAVS